MCVGDVAYMRQIVNAYRILVGKGIGCYNFGEQDLDGEMPLKWILHTDVMWTKFIWPRTLTSNHYHRHEPSDFIKDCKFLNYLGNY